MTISSLKTLQERIRAATGPDLELDHAILETLLPNTRTALLFYGTPFTTYPEGLGACVALMHKVLPGCEWSRDAFGYFWMHVDLGTIHSRRIAGEKLANDCLTFIDAIVSAVLDQQSTNLQEAGE